MLSKFKLTDICTIITNQSTNAIKKIIFSTTFISLQLTSSACPASSHTTQTGIPLDTAWKQKIYEYAQAHVKHSAWGIAHAERCLRLIPTRARKYNDRKEMLRIIDALFWVV